MRAMKLVGKDWVFQQFVLWQSQLLRIRRDFHEHPELGFQTHRTAKRIADILLSPLSRFEPGLTRLRRRNETTSFTAAGIREPLTPGGTTAK